MRPGLLVRILGMLLTAVLVLLILLLNSWGWVRLGESLADLWFILLGALVTVAFEFMVFPEKFSRSDLKIRPQDQTPGSDSLGEALTRQSNRNHARESLQVHYKDMINRMDSMWDYQPTNLGEQIFARGAASATNFGQDGSIISGGRPLPPYLDNDKEHLKAFHETWELYSKGPSLYS